MLDLKTLKDLVKLMIANDLTELELQDQAGERVALKRGRGEPQVTHYVPPPPSPAAAATLPANGGAPSGASGVSETSGGDAGLVPILSPMVGTFYAAATPDSKPFVAAGDRVNAETVVCIVEAMKVFNEIKAEQSGTIARVLVTSGQAVEFGQPLFMVKSN